MSTRHVSWERLGRLEAELSERDLSIVRMVGTLRLVSGRQILRAHWPSTSEADARAASRTLIRLTRDRVLARLDRRVGGLGRGSEAWTYALDTAGQRLLMSGRARHPRLPSPAMWSHVLAGSEAYVRLIEALRGTERRLDLWQGEPACWRSFTGAHGERVRLKPDAFVRVTGGGFTDLVFVEIDTGSQSRAVIRQKLASYRAYAATGTEQAREGVFPQVVFVAVDEARQALLVRVITEQDSRWWPLFAVGGPGDVGRLVGGLS